jgi:hypothetical protein
MCGCESVKHTLNLACHEQNAVSVVCMYACEYVCVDVSL